MNLYSDRNKIIKLFEDKYFIPSNYAFDAKSDLDLILFLIFKIILNTSSQNMKLLQIILLYKFMCTK